MAASLVDTNVLVYAYDPRDDTKKARAGQLLDSLTATGQAVLSVQCLTEFFAAVTRRLPEPMTTTEALERVEHLAQACRVVDLTTAVALEGLRGSARHQLSPWDGLIWAAAKLNQVPYVLTEDAEHGKVLEGIRYLNPFDPSFDVGVVLA